LSRGCSGSELDPLATTACLAASRQSAIGIDRRDIRYRFSVLSWTGNGAARAPTGSGTNEIRYRAIAIHFTAFYIARRHPVLWIGPFQTS
jgi:hypothetical protein